MEMLDKEYLILDQKLSDVERIINSWTGEDLEQLLSKRSEEHAEKMSKGKRKLQELHSLVQKIKTDTEENKKVNRERRKRLQEMNEQCQQLNRETGDIMKKSESISEDVKAMTQKNSKDQELLMMQKDCSKKKLVELEKAKTWFKQILELEFKKTSSKQIQMIFRQIDHKNPSRPFFFFIRVTETSQYMVSECTPPILDLDLLISKLNQTNNLGAFVVAMRKRFKAALYESK